MTTNASIVCEGVRLDFVSSNGGVHVLEDVGLHVGPGELHCLLGPSGCGKSSLLNLVAGLLRPTAGTILVEDRRVGGKITGRVAYLTQKDTLLPWFSARRNVQIPLEAVGRGKSSADVANELLELVGLGGFENYYPHQLSGGMRQRVQLARMLAQSPALVLMDEPFGALDFQTRMLLHRHFLRIWEDRRLTVLFVTHDMNEAITLADRISIMTRRPGRIKAQFNVDIPRPRTIETLVGNEVYQGLYQEIWEQLKWEITEDDTESKIGDVHVADGDRVENVPP